MSYFYHDKAFRKKEETRKKHFFCFVQSVIYFLDMSVFRNDLRLTAIVHFAPILIYYSIFGVFANFITANEYENKNEYY